VLVVLVIGAVVVLVVLDVLVVLLLVVTLLIGISIKLLQTPVSTILIVVTLFGTLNSKYPCCCNCDFVIPDAIAVL
jgi:hypothetical protein